jgi:hypothetical protein
MSESRKPVNSWREFKLRESLSKKGKVFRNYSSEKVEPASEVPEKILYVNAMVEMSTGRILPTVIPFEKLPIEVKIFFKEVLLQEQKNKE